jgi:xanthine/uracil permease
VNWRFTAEDERAMHHRNGESSIGELFGDLSREVSTLVRQEVSLAKVELGQKSAQLGKDAGYVAAGGAVAYAGVLVLLAAVVAGLVALGLDWWLSALLVGAVVCAIGYFLIRKGLDGLKREDLAPRQTIESLKESGQWAKQQVR